MARQPALLARLAAAVSEHGGSVEEVQAPRRGELRGWIAGHARASGVAIEPAAAALLAAALIRQESMFSARISSPVGARGLMQVMPETGRAVAAQLGIEGWGDPMLFQPEINVHIGTRYLAEQMRQYGGSLPAVFSAYNAGPHRVEAWRRFPEFGDEELFTERIPFRETRDYVKILTRNLALYEGLYGASAR
jgi:soluble lytic murein transglycosylase-like protein